LVQGRRINDSSSPVTPATHKQKEDTLNILMHESLQNRDLKKEVGWALILSKMFSRKF
jgi:hypothetical protein